MRMTGYEERDDSTSAENRPGARAEELEGAVFLALGLLLCATFWFGVYLLAGGPLP